LIISLIYILIKGFIIIIVIVKFGYCLVGLYFLGFIILRFFTASFPGLQFFRLGIFFLFALFLGGVGFLIG
jgi:hypothetical protein